MYRDLILQSHSKKGLMYNTESSWILLARVLGQSHNKAKNLQSSTTYHFNGMPWFQSVIKLTKVNYTFVADENRRLNIYELNVNVL